MWLRPQRPCGAPTCGHSDREREGSAGAIACSTSTVHPKQGERSGVEAEFAPLEDDHLLRVWHREPGQQAECAGDGAGTTSAGAHPRVAGGKVARLHQPARYRVHRSWTLYLLLLKQALYHSRFQCQTITANYTNGEREHLPLNTTRELLHFYTFLRIGTSLTSEELP